MKLGFAWALQAGAWASAFWRENVSEICESGEGETYAAENVCAPETADGETENGGAGIFDEGWATCVF